MPVDAVERWPRWVFEVGDALTTGPDLDGTLDAVVAHMEQRVRQRPHLWSWHQRRWKRYHFESRDASVDPARSHGDASEP